MIAEITEITKNILILFALGMLGWALFALLRVPVAPLIGTIALIGGLRVLQVPLPLTPSFIAPLVQVFLGLSVGSKVKRETVGELKQMLVPAVYIVAWAFIILFILGNLLVRFTGMDNYTALLSSSIGGLPEMTVIALSTGADAAVVVVMQTARMLSSIIIFPFVFRRWMNSSRGEEEINDSDCGTLNNKMPTITNSSSLLTKLGGWVEQHVERIIRSGFIELQHNTSERLAIWGWMALSFAIAVAGGFFFLYLEVPAGAMLGAMVFIVSASLIGIRVVQPPKSFYPFMLIGVGLMVADNIGAETLNFLVYGGLFEPVLLSTLLIVLSSILVAYLVHKATQWDFPTCFLAAAPGGFTTMTTMALNFGKDPLRVSILHLFRLLALKVVVPLIIMFFF